MTGLRTAVVALWLGSWAGHPAPSPAASSQPAAAPREAAPREAAPSDAASPAAVVCDVAWRDASRDRELPVRIRLPAGSEAVPVILFSHGLGGTVEAGTDWAVAWVEAGLAVVHLQHPGSDASVWQGQRPGGRLPAMQEAMTSGQLTQRALDVRFVLDRIAAGAMAGEVAGETPGEAPGEAPRETPGGCDLRRLDLGRVGVSGHSFGARTAQLAAGQRLLPRAGGDSFREPRVRAAVAFSPAPPQGPEALQRAAFAGVELPFFSITGTRDEVPALNDVAPEQRLLPHRFMPAGGKHLLVFDGADHAAFSGQARLRQRDPHVTRVVIAATTAFWRATLLDDESARAWLAGDGVRQMLRPGDSYDVR
jgi:predicted dienelactone hydrolase